MLQSSIFEVHKLLKIMEIFNCFKTILMIPFMNLNRPTLLSFKSFFCELNDFMIAVILSDVYIIGQLRT